MRGCPTRRWPRRPSAAARSDATGGSSPAASLPPMPPPRRKSPPAPLMRPMRPLPSIPLSLVLPAAADPHVPSAVPPPVATNPEQMRRRRARDDLDANGGRGDLNHLRRRLPLIAGDSAEERPDDDGPEGKATNERVTRRVHRSHGWLRSAISNRHDLGYRIARANPKMGAFRDLHRKMAWSPPPFACRAGRRVPRAGMHRWQECAPEEKKPQEEPGSAPDVEIDARAATAQPPPPVAPCHPARP
jgi:hypothetical protein